MKRSELIANFSVMVVGMIIVYMVYTALTVVFTQRGLYVVTFSDDRLIMSDGQGDYIDGMEGVHIFINKVQMFIIDLTGLSIEGGSTSSREVYIKFEDAFWKNEEFKRIEPILPSDRYPVCISIEVPSEPSPLSPNQMDIGVPYEPSVWITVFKLVPSEEVCSLVRTPVEKVAGPLLNLTGPTPSPELYVNGHLYFTRTYEKTWVLQGDAWFLLLQVLPKNEDTHEYEVLRYYVKLSLDITIYYEKP